MPPSSSQKSASNGLSTATRAPAPAWTLANDASAFRLKSERFAVDYRTLASQNSNKLSSAVAGLRGGGSEWWIAVHWPAFEFIPLGESKEEKEKEKIKEEGEVQPEIALCFEDEADVKARVEWSVRIVSPAGEELASSSTMRVQFHKKGSNSQSVFTPSAAIQYLDDAKFGLHKDLTKNNWVFDGKLHMTADIRIKILEGGYSKQAISKSQDAVLDALKLQLDNPILSDFSLVGCDGVHIRTHKFILALRSPVFRAMLEKEDSKEVRNGVCLIEDATSACIKRMLGFLYGVHPSEWNFEAAFDLYQLVDKYQITEIREKCSLKLVEGLTTKNVIDVLVMAHQRSSILLQNECFNFLEDNWEKAIMDGTFVQLDSAADSKELHEKLRAHLLSRREGTSLKRAAEDESSESSGAKKSKV